MRYIFMTILSSVLANKNLLCLSFSDWGQYNKYFLAMVSVTIPCWNRHDYIRRKVLLGYGILKFLVNRNVSRNHTIFKIKLLAIAVKSWSCYLWLRKAPLKICQDFSIPSLVNMATFVSGERWIQELCNI